MMAACKALLASLIVGLAMCGQAHAAPGAERGTPQEAMTMVQKVIAFAKANGRDRAIEEVNKGQKGSFFERDMFATISDMNGKVLAHGFNPRLIGKEVLEARDVNGKAFVRESMELMKTKGKGWTDFRAPDPITKQMADKSSYAELYEGMVIGVGIYKE